MKKWMSLLLAAAMTMSLLAGCAGSNAGSTDSTDTTAGTESAGTETADTAAASGETFKIGGIGPVTGGAAVYGLAVKNATELAINEINAAGGINGYQVEFNFQDDELDNEKSVNAYNNLKDWGMNILVGTVTSGCCIAVAAETKNDNMFQLTPSGSSVDIINGNDNVFQVCFTDPNQGVGAADYMSENMAGVKVAVIYRNDDAYSQGIRDTFVKEAASKGIEVVYEGTFTKDSSTDFSVQLTASRQAGADTIFLPIYYQPASVILKQAKDMGYEPTFFGVDGMDGILTLKGFDTSLAEGVMLLTPFAADSTDELTQNFVKTYNDKYGQTPNQFAADAYDAVYAVYEAINKAGCTSDMTTEEICDAIVAVMPNIVLNGLTGQGMTWKSTGEVSKAPKAVVIKNGTYVLPENQ